MSDSCLLTDRIARWRTSPRSPACTIVDVGAAWWRIVDTHRLGGAFTPLGEPAMRVPERMVLAGLVPKRRAEPELSSPSVCHERPCAHSVPLRFGRGVLRALAVVAVGVGITGKPLPHRLIPTSAATRPASIRRRPSPCGSRRLVPRRRRVRLCGL